MLHPRDRTGWSDSSARDVLQLMVESVAELVGFRVAALSVVIGDELVTTAYTGPQELDEDAWASDPVAVLEEVLAVAEPRGRLHFIDGERQHDLAGLDLIVLLRGPCPKEGGRSLTPSLSELLDKLLAKRGQD